MGERIRRRYQAATGIGEFYSINTWGGIDLIRSHGHWRKSFTNIVAGNFGGGPQNDLLLYKRSTLTGELWCVENDGGVSELNTLTNWGPWTHIVA